MTEEKRIPDAPLYEDTVEENDGILMLTAQDGGERADAALAALSGLSRSIIQKYMDAGAVCRMDGGSERPVSKKDKTVSGAQYRIVLPPPAPSDVAPEPIALDIVYEDSAILVLNKPVGMVVHPAPGHTSGTLVNGLLYHCGDSLSGIGGVLRPGIVHRIDRDTTGLLCVAKTDEAHRRLSAQLADHHMHREYRLLAVGTLPESGTVSAPIGRHPTDRKKMAVYAADAAKPGIRSAVTHYRALAYYPGNAQNGSFTLAEAVLETGRTHQIRVHMASIGHPVLGDPVYGGDRNLFFKKHEADIPGQLLHAAALCLTHPVTGTEMRFTAPLPENFTRILHLLEN